MVDHDTTSSLGIQDLCAYIIARTVCVVRGWPLDSSDLCLKIVCHQPTLDSRCTEQIDTSD